MHVYNEKHNRDSWCGFALVGGGSGSVAFCGAFFVILAYAVWYRYWNVGAAPSCKPCWSGNLSKNLENATITPIYIDDTPLGEDEYVSFKEQKIYRMSGGVLTPTDPPVPLPALPTVDGVNIVDYAGQSVAVPSRFMAKYRKEDF